MINDTELNTDNLRLDNHKGKFIIFTIPVAVFLLIILGFSEPDLREKNTLPDIGFRELNVSELYSGNGKINILTEKDIAGRIIDTVYTDKDCWLELRIDQQMLYQHWRNGNINKYPISSGNKFINKGIESRPGLFAVFYKNEHHQSTQFNNADMYHFMTFNQGIGFHSLNGTGYYGNLGVRPSSHGCIRMKHEDARKIFKDCPIGTIVLAHNGKYARTVAFADKNIIIDTNFTKDDYKLMLAENLYDILQGNYYIKERKYFIIDPKVIPVSGIYIAYDREVPKKQKYPKYWYKIISVKDRISNYSNSNIDTLSGYELIDSSYFDNESEENDTNNIVLSDKELIKMYFHNPIGILPYFPPDR